jgi:hypothetical protein
MKVKNVLVDATVIANLLERVNDLDSQLDEIKYLQSRYEDNQIYTDDDITDLIAVVDAKLNQEIIRLESFMEDIAPQYIPVVKESAKTESHSRLKEMVIYDENYNGVKIVVSYADWGLTKRDVLIALLKFVEREEQVEDEE